MEGNMRSPYVSSLSRRRFLGRTGLGAVGLGVAAGGLSVPSGASAQEQVTLSWLTDLPEAELIVAKFEELNPGITVEVETVTFREVFQQNQVRLGSGSDNPCIVSVDAPLVASYGLRGWLVPLDEHFSEEERDVWVDALERSSIYEEQLLAPPIWNSSQLLYYNLDMFEEAGIEPPGPDERWTWEQVADAAKQLTTDDVWGFQFEQANRIYQLQPLPQGRGAPVIGEDGLSVDGIIDSPAWIEAFTWYSNLYNEWGVAPKGEVDVQELFANEKLAMVVRGPWAIKQLIDADLPFEWRAAPHPHWENGEVLVPADSWHLGVNPNCPHIEEAVRFVKFASSTEAGQIWFDTGVMWPPQEPLLDQIINNPENEDWPGKAYTIAAQEAEFAEPRPLTPGYLEYEDILSSAFEDIRNGADVEESLAAAEQRIQRELQKYREA
jgi:ABC-type glycerol-3-phosphate transport system substrate-binding protein